MRVYDLVVVLKTSLSEAQRKKLLDTLKGWLKDGKVVKEESFGQKMLSFPIKKETDGYYVKLSLETDTIPPDFEKRILATEDILRHLLVREK